MPAYAAYGLSTRSSLPLPELTAGAVGTDVVIRRATLQEAPEAVKSLGYGVWAADGAVCLFWSGVGTFLVRGGKEIFVDAAPHFEESRLRLFLLGAVMGVVLHQRGVPAFHASAVACEDGAVVFAGGRGWGKSTMAAILHQRGFPLLADDVTAMKLRNGDPPEVIPSFPQIKLWPDALNFLGEDLEGLPLLSSGYAKRAWAIAEGFSQEPATLSRIYVLGKGPSPKIIRLRPQEAVLELVKNFYIRRFGRDLFKATEGVDFLRCAEIARSVPVYRLERSADLRLLPTLATLVEEHADFGQRVPPDRLSNPVVSASAVN